MDTKRHENFWDDRARENALYFVDNNLDYRHADPESFWRSGEDTVDFVLATLRLAVEPSDDVVDVGCGVGRLTRVLADRARSVRAIDISDEMLRQARELNAHLANVTWVHGDGTTLAGIADSSADAILSHVVFQHIPDPEITYGYVRDMGRVLRPGGWAAFQVSDDPAVHRPRTSMRQRAMAALGRFPRGQSDQSWLGSAVDLVRLREAAVEGGCEVERIVGEGTQFCYVRLRHRR